MTDLPFFQKVLRISLESIVSHFQDISAMGILQGLGRIPSTMRIEVPPALILRMLPKTESTETFQSHYAIQEEMA